MAATAEAYRNFADSDSGKTVFLSPEKLAHHIRYSGIPGHWRNTILAGLRANRGASAIVLWPANIGFMIEAGASRRTIQNRLKRMCSKEAQVLVLARDANTWADCPKCGADGKQEREGRICVKCGYAGEEKEFRRPKTYHVNVAKIIAWPRQKELRSERWRTYKEYKAAAYKKRPQRESQTPDTSIPVRGQKAHEAHSRIASAPPPASDSRQEAVQIASVAAAPVALTPSPPKSESPPQRAVRKLTPREGPTLVRKVTELMRGCTQVTEEYGGLTLKLQTDDPRYRAPMSQDNALVAACMHLGIPYESAREHLKLCRWQFGKKGE